VHHLEMKKRKLQIRQSSARLCPSPEIRSRFLELGWFRGNSATGANQDLATPSYIRLQPRELLSDFQMPLRRLTRVQQILVPSQAYEAIELKIAKEKLIINQ